MKDYESLKETIENFENNYRGSGLEKFSISGTYNLYPEKDNLQVAALHNWPQEWPNHKSPGVYAFFCEKGNLIYIGKASMNNKIGKRLNAWFISKNSIDCAFRSSVSESKQNINPRFVVTVAVPTSSSWEAAALEEFIIKELRPKFNVVGG
jgi:hypothetical protein